MIVKINAAAGSDFPGVNYNDKKIEEGKGELISMNNFPESINQDSPKEDVKNYLASVSKNEKVKKPQFHAVISTKFREHTKEELSEIARNFMEEMGYGKQPFIVVFHNDTENNHVHIVSTRVDKGSGKKINDSFEKLKSQKALSKVMLNLYGEDLHALLEKLMNFKISNVRQLEILLERNGFKMIPNKLDENKFDVLKNGVLQRSFSGNHLVFDNERKTLREKQIKAILTKYKEVYSNKVFKVEDRRHQERMLPEEKNSDEWKPKIEFESELQQKMRKMFGIDIVFHHKNEFQPFGYSLIDNHTGKVFKGSEIMKMNDVFDFTSSVIEKKTFESLKDFNIATDTKKQVLLEFLNKKQLSSEIQGFMLFENKARKSKDIWNEIKNDTKDIVKAGQLKSERAEIFQSNDGRFHVIHFGNHFIDDLEKVLGQKMYKSFHDSILGIESKDENKIIKILEIVEEVSNTVGRNSPSAKDPAEDDLLKKKRKRKK